MITHAIAAFERTLISGTSRVDLYQNNNDKSALNRSETRGLKLFNSEKTNCTTCHSGPDFSNYELHNNGLYQFYQDSGKARVTNKSEDRALFKVPTLRNIDMTGPYMHDGSFSTLEEIVDHYNSGGAGHEKQHEVIRPLNLNKRQKKYLVDFLVALTDTSYLR